MYAPPKPDVPVITADILATYDAFLIGIPTRYGNFPAQWRAFWDTTGGLWAKGALWGKYAGLFVSTAGPGGGQESTALASMSTFAHHGLIYVPLGYKPAFAQISNLSEVHGGSPWGAGTYAVRTTRYCPPQVKAYTDTNQQAGDGSRQPSDLELELATIQGESFGQLVSKVSFP